MTSGLTSLWRIVANGLALSWASAGEGGVMAAQIREGNDGT
jgi:hypothetical protein